MKASLSRPYLKYRCIDIGNFLLFFLAMKPPVPLRPASSREMKLIKDADSGGETVG